MDVQEPTESDAIFDLRDKCMIAQIELHLHEKNLEHQHGIDAWATVTRRLKTGRLVLKALAFCLVQLLFDYGAQRLEIDKLLNLPKGIVRGLDETICDLLLVSRRGDL